MIYLDYSANTPVSEDVLRCFCETEREFFGNPNSTHDAGKAAKERMDEITVSIAGLMGAAPEEIIYTSCASESNNTALKESLRWRVREACILFPLRWSILRWAGV